MRNWYWVWMLVSILTFGCTAQRISPPLLAPAQTIAILPPNNRTDDPLIVAGDSFWDAFATPSQRVTVAETIMDQMTVTQLME